MKAQTVKTTSSKNPAPKTTTAKSTKSAPAAKTATVEKPQPVMEKAETIKAPEKTEKKVAQAPQIQFEQIALRAYLLFEQRGYVHGFDNEDWLEAERQLKFESLN